MISMQTIGSKWAFQINKQSWNTNFFMDLTDIMEYVLIKGNGRLLEFDERRTRLFTILVDKIAALSFVWFIGRFVTILGKREVQDFMNRWTL